MIQYPFNSVMNTPQSGRPLGLTRCDYALSSIADRDSGFYNEPLIGAREVLIIHRKVTLVFNKP